MLYRLPDSLPFEEAALVEALSIEVHAAGRLPVRLGDTALVVGAGMIGSLAVRALKARGCARVVAADLAPERLELARKLGADACIDTRTGDAAAEVKRRVQAEAEAQPADATTAAPPSAAGSIAI